MRRTIFVVVVLVAFATLAPVGQRSSQASTPTYVSLTFDDASATQYPVLRGLAARGMAGTLYVNSAMVGTSKYYMTWPQVRSVATAGNEIGGHTLHHANLASVSSATAKHETCDDRSALISQRFPPVASFAYPNAGTKSTAKKIVKSCGYRTGRGVGGINSITACTWCPYAETVPPADPYKLRTPEGAKTSTTLAELKRYVTNAETHGGGWVILVFHGICNNRCTGDNSLRPSVFNAFINWLKPRSALGTTVHTVGQVSAIGLDKSPPTTSLGYRGAALASWYRPPVSVELVATDVGGSGVVRTRYTTDGSDPKTNPRAAVYSGPVRIESTQTIRYYSRDLAGNMERTRTLTVRIDAQRPSVKLKKPAERASFKRGSMIALAIAGSDRGSGVARVAFFDGRTRLAVDATAPYGVAWYTGFSKVGAHTLTAVALDRAKNSTRSIPVHITLTK